MNALALMLLLCLADDFDRHVSDLGNRQHKVRAAAAEALYKLGSPALPRLEEAKAGKDIDTRRRLESIAARIRGEQRLKALDLVQQRYGAPPMIDAWWLDHRWQYDAVSSTSTFRALTHHALYHYLRRAMESNVPDPRRWGPYRLATALWFADMAEAGVPTPILDLIYLEMRRRDNRWIKANNFSPPDPWHWPGTKVPEMPKWMSSVPEN